MLSMVLYVGSPRKVSNSLVISLATVYALNSADFSYMCFVVRTYLHLESLAIMDKVTLSTTAQPAPACAQFGPTYSLLL